MRFKTVAIFVCLTLFSLACVPALSQTPGPPVQPPVPPVELQELVAAGASFNQTSTPQISGNTIYAHRVAAGLYSFTAMDIFVLKPVGEDALLPNAPKYFIATSTTTGLAQFLRGIGPVKIYVIATVGAAAGGTRLGWAYTTGGCAYIPIVRGFCAIPSFRALKTSLGDFQGIYGIAFGWGK